ncbi:MAG: hypothetical protein AAF039_15015 [Bacteroidota bacterium]
MNQIKGRQFIKKITKAFILLVLLSSCTEQNLTVQLTSSSPNSLWTKSELSISPMDNADNAIEIDVENEQQTVEGFGACFNELGWEAINQLPHEKQELVFEFLFDKTKGCDFNTYRIPIGANDYALDWYSHNETPEDFEMKNFSIARDKQRIIPYINKAKSYNTDFRIWGSPWCPPSWMKHNKHYACNPAPVNDLPEEGKGQEMETQFIMEADYLNAYSKYLLKFVQAYANEGIDVYSIHIQNEPNSCQSFPSCVWNPSDMALFIGDYLGPHFNQELPDTEIWLGTIERPQIERVDAILGDEKASKYIKGVGFQWGGKGAIPQVHKKYPNIGLMQTETECGDGSNDWAAAVHTYGLMKHYFNNGANTYLYWNMVLNETGKSQWGWKQNSMISIDSKTKEVTFNPEFYLMKHFSNHIKPGARKVKTSNQDVLAFKDRDAIVIIYYNPEERKVIQKFKLGEKVFQLELNGNSFNTITLPLI